MKTLAQLRSRKTFIFYSLCLFICLCLGYSRLKGAYFANDEFKYIAGVRIDGLMYLLNKYSWIQILTGLYRPIGTLIQNYFYKTFPYNPTPFIVFGFIIHFLNCIVLYILVQKLTKNSIIAFFSGIFFACSSVYVQTLSWLACIVDVPASSLFALLSCLVLLQYVDTKCRTFLFLSVLCSYISFLIRDSNVFLFAVLPLMLFLFEYKKRQFTLSFYTVSFGLLILFIVVRVTSTKTTESNYLLALSGVSELYNGWYAYGLFAYRAFLYPLIGITQIIIPARFLMKVIGFSVFHKIFPKYTDAALALFSLVILGLPYGISKHNLKNLKAFYIAALLYWLSFAPIALFLVQRGSAFIESRYMYFPTMMFSIIIAYGVNAMISLHGQRVKTIRKIFVTLFLFCFGLYLLKQTLTTRSLLDGSTKEQQDIKNLTMQLFTYKSLVPDNPIFYLTSDYDYFWPHNKVPFQEGTGYMFMAIYLDTGKIPFELVRNLYLEKFGSQGYMTIRGQGFGFFYDENELIKLYQNNSFLNPNQIIAFEYSSSSKTIHFITQKIRDDVERLR